jgi:hypothetical protein
VATPVIYVMLETHLQGQLPQTLSPWYRGVDERGVVKGGANDIKVAVDEAQLDQILLSLWQPSRDQVDSLSECRHQRREQESRHWLEFLLNTDVTCGLAVPPRHPLKYSARMLLYRYVMLVCLLYGKEIRLGSWSGVAPRPFCHRSQNL